MLALLTGHIVLALVCRSFSETDRLFRLVADKQLRVSVWLFTAMGKVT